MTGFWEAINAQLDLIEREGRTADDVLRILGRDPDGCAGDGFFAGSGGDRQLRDALSAAGWRIVKSEASYYYVAEGPTGDLLTYIEGDVYRGDQMGGPA